MPSSMFAFAIATYRLVSSQVAYQVWLPELASLFAPPYSLALTTPSQTGGTIVAASWPASLASEAESAPASWELEASDDASAAASGPASVAASTLASTEASTLASTDASTEASTAASGPAS